MALTVTVTMPPEQGDAVLDTLLTLYQALAEALQLSTLTYLDDKRSLGPVLERRDELVEVEALIDLLGWSFGRVDPVELTGPPGLVRETVYATLVDGGALRAGHRPVRARRDRARARAGAGQRVRGAVQRVHAARAQRAVVDLMVCRRAFGLESLRTQHQLRRADVERVGDLADVREAGVAVSTLDPSQVRAMDATQIRKLLLGDAAPAPEITDGGTEGDVCWGLRHGVANPCRVTHLGLQPMGRQNMSRRRPIWLHSRDSWG
jgi:hypothetical protein